MDHLVEGHLDNERRMLSSLSDREQAQLAGLLRKLLVAHGDSGGPPGATR